MALITSLCAHCKKPFIHEQFKNKKYCSHDCYAKSRQCRIEKACAFCGKLKQQSVVRHKRSHDWEQLKQQVHAFLAAYNRQAPDLLRYVGLAN